MTVNIDNGNVPLIEALVSLMALAVIIISIFLIL